MSVPPRDPSPGPGEPDADEPTTVVTTPSTAEVAKPAATVVCRACGAANPPGRTLCDRCGMGLVKAALIDDGRAARWRRYVRLALLVSVLLIAPVAGWLAFRDGITGIVGQVVAAGVESDDASGPVGGDGRQVQQADAPGRTTVVIQSGDTGRSVARWQRLLQAAGLDVTADGVFGPATQRATRRFQTSVNLESTGQVTTSTLEIGRRASTLRRIRVYLLRGGELHAVAKRVDEGQLVRGVVLRLLGAPTDAERRRGLSTAIPAGAMVGDVTVDLGLATVRLDGFAQGDGGTRRLRRRVNQLVWSLTDLPSVDEVLLDLPADDRRVFADVGIDLTQPRRRHTL